MEQPDESCSEGEWTLTWRWSNRLLFDIKLISEEEHFSEQIIEMFCYRMYIYLYVLKMAVLFFFFKNFYLIFELHTDIQGN